MNNNCLKMLLKNIIFILFQIHFCNLKTMKKTKEQLKREFLEDKDDDLPEGAGTKRVEVDEHGNIIEKPLRVEGKPLTTEMKNKIYTYKNIYKRSAHPRCQDHLFCLREKMTLEQKEEEVNPLMPPALDGKHAEEVWGKYLRQPFYLRNIQEKKKALAEGIVPTDDNLDYVILFQDDGIEKYEPTEQAMDYWQYRQSKELGEKLEKQRAEDERKLANLKKQMQRDQQHNQALGTTHHGSIGGGSLNLGNTLTHQLSQQMSMMDPYTSNFGQTFGQTMGGGGINQGQQQYVSFNADASVMGGPGDPLGLKKDRYNQNYRCTAPKGKCCQTWFYHYLQPTGQSKKTIPLRTRDQEFQDANEQLQSRAKQIIDVGISDAMRSHYGPFDRQRKTEGASTGKRGGSKQGTGFYFDKSKGKQGSNAFQSAPNRKSTVFSKQPSVSQGPGQAAGAETFDTVATLSMADLLALQNPEKSVTASKLVKRTSFMGQKQDPQDAEKLMLRWKENAEAVIEQRTRDFLDEMHYRHTNEINAQTDYRQKQAKKDTNPECTDFSDVVEASSLQMLTKEKLDENRLASIGVRRSNFLRGGPKSPGDEDDPYVTQSGSSLRNREDANLGVYAPNKFMDPEALERVRDCRNILQNQKLYAQTILVNARTGGQLKSQQQSRKQARGKSEQPGASRRNIGNRGDGFKNNTFQKYQGNLFTQTSNNQIAQVLNTSKRYQLSQMKEDFGIMKYIKNKYYQENFGGSKEKDGKLGDDNSSDFIKNNLEKIKKAYFQNVLQDVKSGPNQGMMDPSQIHDKIAQVDEQTRAIYQEELNNREGLNSNYRQEVYQFAEDRFIALNMIGQQAVDEQVQMVKGIQVGSQEAAVQPSPIESQRLNDDLPSEMRIKIQEAKAVKELRPQKDGGDQLPSSPSAQQMKERSQLTSFRTDNDFDTRSHIGSVTKGELPQVDDHERKTAQGDMSTQGAQKSQYGDESSVSKSKRPQQNTRASSSHRQSQHQSRRVGIKSGSQVNKNQHPVQQQKSVQQVYLDSDYWYHKGVVLNQMNENEYALNCYNQALKLNRNHKASIFNLACAYEKLATQSKDPVVQKKNYDEGLQGFQHAIDVDERWPDAHYGLALCSLKLAQLAKHNPSEQKQRNADAVRHIENAVKWSIQDYKDKVEMRRQRQLQRKKEIELARERGELSPSPTTQAGIDGKTQGNATDGTNASANAQSITQLGKNASAEMEYCPEDEDASDDLYIDPATQRNGGVSTHIMYVRALCHRETQAYAKALESYAKVMKRQHEIGDYEKKIEQENFQNLALKSVEGPGFPGWKMDFYSHFQRLKLLKQNERIMMIDLRVYYTWRDGWNLDRIPDVIKDLQRIRFFNRFDRETLYQMMKKTDLRVVRKHNLLFLEKDQCAIVINGNLHLFSHKHDVATPILQAIYTPGDIIGNPEIDGTPEEPGGQRKSWSRDTHSWIIAYAECDILVMNIDYVNYLWDKMKGNSQVNFIAERLKAKDWFSHITEQSIYTIAFDLLYFKKFDHGQKICPQTTKSTLNFEYSKKQQRAIDKFMDGTKDDAEFQHAYKIFLKEKNPHPINDLCAERSMFKDYQVELLRELVRRDQLYGKKKKKDGDSTDREDYLNSDPEDDGSKDGSPAKYDPYYLPLPKFNAKLTPAQLESEKEERDKRQDRYTEMVKFTEKIEDTAKYGLLKLTEKAKNQLEEYKKNKGNFPKDSDGIYMLLEGSFSVKNIHPDELQGGTKLAPIELYPKFEKAATTGVGGTTTSPDRNRNQTKLDTPDIIDVIGAERFLMVQGFSYYGSIYASAEKKNGNKPQTTCGFIPAEKLYLLPFYDLYKLKEDLERRYGQPGWKCAKLKKNTLDLYNYQLKKQQS